MAHNEPPHLDLHCLQNLTIHFWGYRLTRTIIISVGGVPMPRVQRTSSVDGEPVKKGYRMRSMSMEEADQPTGMYSSSPNRFGSPPKQGVLSTSPKQ